MKILVIGDIIGKPGRTAVTALLPDLRQQYSIDYVIANGENTAGGIGLTPPIAKDLHNHGVDFITSGNHIFKHREIIPYLDNGELPIIRPLNYPPRVPGIGYMIKNDVMVVNLEGRVFMSDLDCPFQAIDRLLDEVNPKPKTIVVDFHAEATSEKGAMGVYLDGRVSAIVGTHTHIGTVDARILPQGSGFVTDIGMVGPLNSVIGNESENIIEKFLTQTPQKFIVGKGTVVFNSVLLEIDEDGKTLSIKRVDIEHVNK